ncbi:NUDIX hydrolase [Nocardioides albus]|uniref:8-oxo-dGTP pyrophosphatase MutT (NUDIX family) n=1 Tax=Nocardioides albus TaxID=1841 RepID=A0A7W5A1Z3_9ACTN|nr:NUDIX hydrolase [Nocardioides albus]MBB3088213.1 8-oxo-dGTP pyrophosphatase MutT (NUDIX family) [Nocardioides albus]
MRIPIPPVRLGDDIVALAGEYAEGVRTPVEPRDAATVLLLRPGSASGPEVYLLRRQLTMGFAAGMAVFPGGGVDVRDAELPDSCWAGPSAGEWARRLGVEESRARALVAAAVRETFEECGVLLAGTSADAVVDDVSGSEWEADRVALESRALSLTELLTRRGLVLRTDLLAPWAAWTTPVFEPKRFATWFFVARLPEGQLTRDVSSESSSVLWLGVADAVAQVEAGELAMMPPTYLNCLEVASIGSEDEVLADAAGRTLTMFTPAVTAIDGGHTLSMMPMHEKLMSGRGRS